MRRSSGIITAVKVILPTPWGQRLLRISGVTLAASSVVAFYLYVLHVNQTTVALTFLVLVLFIASRWRLAYSVYASVLCTLLYNYYFLPPINSLEVNDPQNFIAMFAFLACSILVSHLSESEHHQASLSEKRREEVERLYEFSRRILLQDNFLDVAHTTPQIIAEIFQLRAVALYVRDEEAVYLSNSSDTILPMSDLMLAAQAPEFSRQVPPDVRIVPLTMGLRTTGVLALRDSGYSKGVYGAIGGLVAIALERASALERFSFAEAAREGERLRAALIDSVTHDLRTPLTAIRAAATSLTGGDRLGDAEYREMIAIVDEESARLDRLIGQAIDMAQIEATGIKVHAMPQHLREVIDLALDDRRSLLRDRSVDVQVADTLPAVLMDRELIRRVLRHLIENAAKYSPAGTPIRLRGALDAGRLVVQVTDQGQGIDPGEQDKIFDKFFRGKRQRQRVQGTGMGLAIVKAIMAAHGGGIAVTSRPGDPTTFTLWIPAQTKTPAASG